MYGARRVADYLATAKVTDWPRVAEGPAVAYQPADLAHFMTTWPKFTSLGAEGPDLMMLSQDFNTEPLGPESNELMLALTVYYFYKTAKAEDWEPLLLILEHVSSTLAALVRFLMMLDRAWKDFESAWASTIGPFVNAADAALDDLTGGVVSAFGDALMEFKKAIELIGLEELLTFKDIFGNFNTCIHKGFDEQNFLLSDLSHYRRTTRMAAALFAQAETLRSSPDDGETKYEQFMAFACGWTTHIAFDTIGHSFVNEQVGGPFRDHPGRHHLIEAHMDAWNYREAGPGGAIPSDPLAANHVYQDLSYSGLGFAVQMDPAHPQGSPRPANLPADRIDAKNALAADGAIPLWMAEAIVHALINTFGDESPRQDDQLARPFTHPKIYKGSAYQQQIDEGLLTRLVQEMTGHALDKPFAELLADIAPDPGPTFVVPEGFPLPWQVQTMYRLLMTFLQMSYRGDWELYKPRRPDVLITPPSSDISNLLSPPDFSGPTSADPIEDVCDALKSLFDWINKEVDAALKLAGDLIKMLASPASYPIRLGLYELAMLAWDIVSRCHEVIAQTGLFVPHGAQYYDDNKELRLGNEIDRPLITLGGSVDATFQQALADAFDPLGNLDKNPSLPLTHDVKDPNYPYLPVMEFNASTGFPLINPPGSFPETPGTAKNVEYKRVWAYPDHSPDDTHHLTPTGTELYDPTKPAAENPPATTRNPLPGPFPEGSLPSDVLFGTRTADPIVRAQYESARTPAATDALNEQFLLPDGNDLGSPLGDPIPFSAYLIGKLANGRRYDAQFNLDADRGFGYLTWDWIRSVDSTPESADVMFPFRPPSVWPQGSKHWHGLNETLIHMELEYVDKPGQGKVGDVATVTSSPRRTKGAIR
jgi:hypothetical protein